jgi:hypothetical protein
VPKPPAFADTTHTHTHAQMGRGAVPVSNFRRDRWVRGLIFEPAMFDFKRRLGQEAGASDGHGGSFGRDVRSRCASWLLLRNPDMCWLTHLLGCDALNTTVSALWRSRASSLFFFSVCVDADLARGHPRLPRTESWPVMVDLRFASWHACQFLFNHLGGISHWLVIRLSRVPHALMSELRPIIPRSFLRPCRRYPYDRHNIYYNWLYGCVQRFADYDQALN